MADINSVTIAGRLTRDAELKYTNSGMAVVRFAVAVNTRKKDGNEWIDEANFFDITLFGKAGEAINSYLTKGKQVAVTGSLRQDRWEQDGQNRTRVYIMADNVMLLGGREGASSGMSHDSYDRAPERNMAPQRRAKPPVAEDDFEDDIPF